MNGVESIELIFGMELVAVFTGNDEYEKMIQDIRLKYKKRGINFPIVNLRDDLRLSGTEYQILMNGEIVFDREIANITEKTMEEMIGQINVSFCGYCDQHSDNDQ